MRTPEQIAGQLSGNYANYIKQKRMEDVGHFLQNYVVDGGGVTQDPTYNNRIVAEEIVVSLNGDVMRRDGQWFTTRFPLATWYLDFGKDGDWRWSTSHPAGTAGTDYLTIATVTTNGMGNVATITDTRGHVGGFLLKDEYGLENYATQAQLAETSQLVESVKNNIGLSFRNNDGAITRLLNNGQTYVKNTDEFSYGFNDPLWIPGEPLVTDENGKYRINCSTLDHLLLKGVPFEKSRYGGRAKNIVDEDFNQTFKFPPDFASAAMARWLTQNGFGFYPKPDFSNVEVGDILFFSWTNPEWWTPWHELEFMMIDHSATVARKNDDGSIAVYEVGSIPVFNTYTFDLLSTDVVYACRMPFNNVDLPIENIIINGNTPHTATGTYFVNTYNLSKPLKPHKWYTAVIKGTIDTDKCFFSVRSGSNTLETGVLHATREDGLYTYHFTTGGIDISAGTINIIIGAKPEDNILDADRYGTVEWFVVTEGYTYSIKDYISGKITKDFTFTFSEGYTGYYNIYYNGDSCLLSIRLTGASSIADNALLTIGTITGSKLKTNVNLPCTAMIGLTASPSYSSDVTAWVQSDTTPYRLRIRNGTAANKNFIDIACVIPI